MADPIDYAKYYDASYFNGGKTYRHPDGSVHAYHGPALTWEGFQLVADALGALLGTPVRKQTLLDIGCSAGDLAQRMIRYDFDPLGVEVSQFAIENAVPAMRGRIALADISQCPAELRPHGYQTVVFPDQFDVVLGTDLLEHIYEEDIERTFAWMVSKTRRWLFFCVATVLDPGSIWFSSDKMEFVARKGEPIPIEWEATAASGHVNVRHWRYWEDMFKRHGLRIDWELAYKFQMMREHTPAWRDTGGWQLPNTWFLEKC